MRSLLGAYYVWAWDSVRIGRSKELTHPEGVRPQGTSRVWWGTQMESPQTPTPLPASPPSVSVSVSVTHSRIPVAFLRVLGL